MKTCKKCGATKPLDDFHTHPEGRMGRRPECRDCFNVANKARRDANLEEHRQRDRERYANNPARRAAQIKTARKHYHDNLERERAQRKAYYQANPEVYERARTKRQAMMRGAEHDPYSRTEIYERDEGRCRDCQKRLENKPNGFHIDHIVPISLGGPDIPANVQLMCPPCNRSKWAKLDGQIHLPV